MAASLQNANSNDITSVISTLGQRAGNRAKDGKPLDTVEAQFDETVRLVRNIEQETLPMLEALRMTW